MAQSDYNKLFGFYSNSSLSYMTTPLDRVPIYSDQTRLDRQKVVVISDVKLFVRHPDLGVSSAVGTQALTATPSHIHNNASTTPERSVINRLMLGVLSLG
jgi:hypothetical protein